MRKLALTGVLALGCLFWTALTPQQILNNSATFGSYGDTDFKAANTYLLATLAGVAINPANILSNAAAFGSYGDHDFQMAQTYLLSQITSTGGGGATNGIQMLNGFGTNTFLTNLTADPGVNFSSPDGTKFGAIYVLNDGWFHMTNSANTFSLNGDVGASSFTGIGSGLTLLNAGALSSGTVPAGVFPALIGDITTPGGSLSTTLKNTGTAGTYTKTTFDAQGRETSGASAVLASADFSNQGVTTTNILHGNGAGNPSWGPVLTNDFAAATFAWLLTLQSGGSQTPWASDIAGAGFNLSGAGSIGGSNIVSAKFAIITNQFNMGTNGGAHMINIMSTSNDVVAVNSTGTDSASMFHIRNLGVQGPFFSFESQNDGWGYGVGASGSFILRHVAGATDGVNGTNVLWVGTDGVASFTNTVTALGFSGIGAGPAFSWTNTLGAGGNNGQISTNGTLLQSNALSGIVFLFDGTALLVTNKTAATTGSSIGPTGVTNYGGAIVGVNGLIGTNATLWAINTTSFATNYATAGAGTITWDVSKASTYIATNAAVTINLTGLPTTNVNFPNLTISNSAASGTILITCGGFCVFTNGSGVATSTFYATNLDAKHQTTDITLKCRPGTTNGIVTAFYDK